MILDRFSDAAFRHKPLAAATGPFAQRAFLEIWWRHLAGSDELALVSEGDGALPLRLHGKRLHFVGGADVTDYHSPLGEPAASIAEAASAFTGVAFSFDSLPAEAADALGAALGAGGHPHDTVADEVTMVVDLSAGLDNWLSGLRKKDRHEIRRKQRMFNEALGEPRLERMASTEAAKQFADLHRGSAGAKGSFMVPEHEAFFLDLVRDGGATVELLHGADGVVAAAFGFAAPDAYYLYNSAYDPGAADVSPGIVLVVALIERLAEDGVERLDLLKGDERYKFRLGGRPRRLLRIEGTFA